jgi:hypothetical protein
MMAGEDAKVRGFYDVHKAQTRTGPEHEGTGPVI